MAWGGRGRGCGAAAAAGRRQQPAAHVDPEQPPSTFESSSAAIAAAAAEVPSRRSCTPDRAAAAAADPTPTLAAATATATPTPSGANARQLTARMKAVFNDALALAASQPAVTAAFVDDCIKIVDEGLRALRTAKVENRATLRRLQSNPLPLLRNAPEEAAFVPLAATASAETTTAAAAVAAAAVPATTPDEAATAPPPPPLQPSLPRQRSYAAVVKRERQRVPADSPKKGVSPPPHHAAPVPSEPAVLVLVPAVAAASAAGSGQPQSASPEKAATATAAAAATPTGAAPTPSLPRQLQEQERRDARDSSALRSEERRRQASERRRELHEQRQEKFDAAAERTQRALNRRALAVEHLRVASREHADEATRRAAEAKAASRDKAARANTLVDEVLLVGELARENRALRLESHMSDVEQAQVVVLEQRREEAARVAKDRSDAHTAVVGRQKDLSHQRAERQAARDQVRAEALRRVEEQRRQDTEAKHQRLEERKEKVQSQQQAAHAELEAKSRRTEEKITQSAALREEQRQRQLQKLERAEQKLRDARDRRDKEEAVRRAFQALLPPLTAVEEEQAQQRLHKSASTAIRQAKAFVDTYQKDCALSAKDLNRSRLRPLFTRLVAFTSTNVSQSRPLLHDIASVSLVLQEVDHEYVRYYNAFDALVRILLEARKAHDVGTLRLASDVLHRYLADAGEGSHHIRYVLRAGHHVALIAAIHDEIKGLKSHTHFSPALACIFSIVQLCVGGIVGEAHAAAKLAPIRDQVLNDLEVAGVDRFCLAVAATVEGGPDVCELDMPPLQYALLTLLYQIAIVARKKHQHQQPPQPTPAATPLLTSPPPPPLLPAAPSATAAAAEAPAAAASGGGGALSAGLSAPLWARGAVAALLTFLQNVLTPGGQPLSSGAQLGPMTTCAVFTALRVINNIARWRFEAFQEMLRATPTAKDAHHSPSASAAATAALPSLRHELFHVLLHLVGYVAANDDSLERVPGEPCADSGAGMSSFIEAARFGVTHTLPPRVPLPPSATTSSAAAPSSVRSVATAAATANTSAATAAAAATASCAAPTGASAALFVSGVNAMPEPGYFLRAALHEAILLAGYATLYEPSVQEIFSWGQGRPLLARLLGCLPVVYFAQLRHVLYPTLLCIVLHSERNLEIARREIDLGGLAAFVREGLEQLPTKLRRAAAAFKTEVSKPVAPVKKSWAEMADDDDEDETLFHQPSTAAADALRNAEKERLAKALLAASASAPVAVGAAAAAPPTAAATSAAPTSATGTGAAAAAGGAAAAAQACVQPTPLLPSAAALNFRFDRRVPPALWADALAFVEQAPPPKRPSSPTPTVAASLGEFL